MKKRYFCILFAIIFNSCLFCSEFDSALDDFLNLRVNLTQYENKAESAAALKSHWNEYWKNNDFNKLSQQEQIIMNNFYILEEYNYIWENHENDKYLLSAFQKQIDLSENYISNHSDVMGWLYVTASDIFSCVMSYNPVSGAMKYGLKVKDYYEKCLKVDSENAYCLTHYAQWFYWAPGVNGGSRSKSLKYFEEALKCSKKSYDIFYSELFLSQILFENKDFSGNQLHMSNALKVFPESHYAKELKDLNDSGYSLFSYNKKKAKDENRVSDKY